MYGNFFFFSCTRAYRHTYMYFEDIFSNIVDSGEDMKVQCVLLLHEET